MTDYESWRNFGYESSAVQLWVFKKSVSKKNNGFVAFHVRTAPALETHFRNAMTDEISRLSEVSRYTAISQVNESSCLIHELNNAGRLVDLLVTVDLPEGEGMMASQKDLNSAFGYLVKFQHQNQQVYAVRRAPSKWRPKVKASFVNAFFRDGELSLVEDESFLFDSCFDFYCFNESVFIVSKRGYEGLASDSLVYERNFENLLVDSSFAAIFSSIEPLKAYVSSSIMHQRRMTVVQQKGFYRMPDFCNRLRKVSDKMGWNLNFDNDNRIIICSDTARAVIQVLLDHRLTSMITDMTYDVPDAEVVSE